MTQPTENSENVTFRFRFQVQRTSNPGRREAALKLDLQVRKSDYLDSPEFQIQYSYRFISSERKPCSTLSLRCLSASWLGEVKESY